MKGIFVLLPRGRHCLIFCNKYILSFFSTEWWFWVTTFLTFSFLFLFVLHGSGKRSIIWITSNVLKHVFLLKNTCLFYKHRFFATQPQCCLIFSWIEFHMVLRCCLVHTFIVGLRHVLYVVNLCQCLGLGLFMLYLGSNIHFKPHFHQN